MRLDYLIVAACGFLAGLAVTKPGPPGPVGPVGPQGPMGPRGLNADEQTPETNRFTWTYPHATGLVAER